MSLIHDALRKAAEENQHGRAERPRSWRDVEPLPPPRPLWPRLALAGLAVLIAGSIAFFALRPSGPAAPPAPAATVAEAPKPIPALEAAPASPPPVPTPSATPPAEEPAVLAPPASEPPATATPLPAPTAAPLPVAPPPAVATAPVREPEPPAVQPAAPPPAPAPRVDPPPAAAAAPAPKLIVPPAQTGQVEGDTYVLEAEVEGKRLLLDFIVWSDAPFAQINGRQVGVGQQVEGFLVTAIARDSVLLETPTRKVRLKVR